MGPFTGLPIPAHSEIVIEGECYPGEFVDEGPFGEWHGFYANRGLKSVPELLIHIKAIYHRDNPILTCSQPAVPPHTFTLMLAFADSVVIRRRLEEYGIPGIRAVWSHYTGSGGLFNVFSIKQLYSGHARQVGLIPSQYLSEMGGYTVVVEEDIDPSNLKQYFPSEKRSTEKGKPLTAARVIIDACRDISWKEDWYPIAYINPEFREEILKKWRNILSGFIENL